MQEPKRERETKPITKPKMKTRSRDKPREEVDAPGFHEYQTEPTAAVTPLKAEHLFHSGGSEEEDLNQQESDHSFFEPVKKDSKETVIGTEKTESGAAVAQKEKQTGKFVLLFKFLNKCLC